MKWRTSVTKQMKWRTSPWAWQPSPQTIMGQQWLVDRMWYWFEGQLEDNKLGKNKSWQLVETVWISSLVGNWMPYTEQWWLYSTSHLGSERPHWFWTFGWTCLYSVVKFPTTEAPTVMSATTTLVASTGQPKDTWSSIIGVAAYSQRYRY